METPEERAWREAYQAGMQAGSDACPDDETLTALAMGELAGAERVTLAGHVSQCRRCAESYRTLRALHAESGRRLPRRRVRWPAVAAAAVLAAGLGVTLIWVGRELAPDEYMDTLRGGATDEELVRPVDNSVLDASPASLAWPPQHGATGYRVRLYDATAQPLGDALQTGTAEIELPAAIREELLPGKAYFWVVDVKGVATPRRLGPYWFELQATK